MGNLNSDEGTYTCGTLNMCVFCAVHYALYLLFLLQPTAEESIEDNKDDIKEHAMEEEEEEKPVPEVVPEVEAAKPPEATEQRIEMEEEEEEEEGEPKYIPRLLDGAGKGYRVPVPYLPVLVTGNVVQP